MTESNEHIVDIDRALRELPLCKPEESAWEQIVSRLEGDEETAERRSRWLWASVAVLVVAFNSVFFWPADVEDGGGFSVAEFAGYNSNLYSAEQELQVAVLKRRIAHLDQLIPFGNLEEQLELFEYRNELRDRLERVSFQPSGSGVRL